MKSIFIKITYVFIAILVLIPVTSFAAEMKLDASKGDLRIGEDFLVSVVLYSDDTVNAAEGRIIFPAGLLRVKEIRDGNSPINFWIEKPHVVSPGIVIYSGVTPGGFSGPDNILFTIVFEAREKGIAQIIQEKLRVLENDGIGTETAFTRRDIEINIRSGDGSSIKETKIDNEAPEIFTPVVVEDLSVFDGKYFLVFATQDKGSGMKRYDVREGRFGWWKEAESPYLLARSELDRDIYVRAIDNAGNERVVVLPTSMHDEWLEQYGFLVILILLIIVVIIYKRHGHIL